MRKIFLLIILVSTLTFSQENESVQVVGDSLTGKTINGENIREVIGNVVITQGDVVITCRKAIQYITKNEFELIGNVVATQDTLVIETEKAYYFGNTKIAESDTLIYLREPSFDLKANKGKYFYNDELAQFFGDVVLNDSAFQLTSQELYYFKTEERINAKTNVQVMDSTSIIFADSIRHFRNEKLSFAFGNVRVDNFENNVLIYGDSLVNDNQQKYSKVTGSPLFIQIDTSNTGKLDTLMITGKILESYTDSTKKFIATDNVKIIRDDFSSVNDKSIFYNAEERIETYKLTDESPRPIIWSGENQLVGDSVFIYLKEQNLDWIDVRGSSLIISKKENFDWRYDQMSGNQIKMFFNDSTISKTEVFDNVLSIYYMFEDGEPSGLIKSSSENAKILFEDGQVVDVRLYKSVMSEYHPENLVDGKEREFTLPQFIVYENRPSKDELKKLIRK
ncbi:MAG: LPS export ABC transporter periplasmic protein LptC [Melioribacteraceae bacterium]|nr:LPS export ABC transporter periplasmic protein LptC [Melioribacteraceae bacterium]